jgi:23S rRNA pseudouridine955/2504/2580 synthase/23S rRNA pseudouridine1911/1915/1917 synthase
MESWTITESEDGERLVNLIKSRLGDGWSKRRVKASIDAGAAFVNESAERRASYRVQVGDTIAFNSGVESVPSARPWWEEEGRILYEDSAVVVLDKPAGVTSDDDTVWETLMKRWPNAELVHRLDKYTSGAWIFAKGEESCDALIDQFRERTVYKHYLAIVDGLLDEKEGEIDLPIQRMKVGVDKNIWKVSESGNGRTAVTHFVLDGVGDDCSLVSCYPKTGRTHQIRLHMQAIGYPILGDFLYCRDPESVLKPSRQMLHARTVKFISPATDQEVEIECPIPEDMRTLIEGILK